MSDWHECPKRKCRPKITWEICVHNNCPNLETIWGRRTIEYECKFKSTDTKRIDKWKGKK